MSKIKTFTAGLLLVATAASLGVPAHAMEQWEVDLQRMQLDDIQREMRYQNALLEQARRDQAEQAQALQEAVDRQRRMMEHNAWMRR